VASRRQFAREKLDWCEILPGDVRKQSNPTVSFTLNQDASGNQAEQGVFALGCGMRKPIALAASFAIWGCGAPNPTQVEDEKRAAMRLVSEGQHNHAYYVDDRLIDCMSEAVRAARPTLSLGATHVLATPTVRAMDLCHR